MALTRSDLESNRLQQAIIKTGTGVVLSEAQLQESLCQTLLHHPPNADIWVFAYGSLIWNPIIKVAEQRIGKIYGWHRRFCLWVPQGRGTPDNRGLVLGLDRGVAVVELPIALLRWMCPQNSPCCGDEKWWSGLICRVG